MHRRPPRPEKQRRQQPLPEWHQRSQQLQHPPAMRLAVAAAEAVPPGKPTDPPRSKQSEKKPPRPKQPRPRQRQGLGVPYCCAMLTRRALTLHQKMLRDP